MEASNDKPDRAPKKPKWYGDWKSCLGVVVTVAAAAYIMFGHGIGDRSQWIIALFTVVMTWVMIEQNRKFDQQNRVMIAQNRAIKKQIAQTEVATQHAIESLKLTKMQLRSWLDISAERIDSPFEPGKSLRVVFNVANSGDIAAKIVEHRTLCTITSGSSAPSIARQNGRNAQPCFDHMIVPPKGDIEIELPTGDVIEPPMYSALLAKFQELYIGGIFVYEDELGTHESFDFVYRLDVERLLLIRVADNK